VGQSLIAAAAVSGVGFVAALIQAIWVTRPYEAIVSLGIRRFRRRGNPGWIWERQLRGAESRVTFFGKDHSRLIAAKYEVLKRLLIENNVTVRFYLLSEQDPYFLEMDKSSKDYNERMTAARKLYELKREVSASKALAADLLILKQYMGSPTFTCTMVDDMIIFGPYLPNRPNPDVPEFEIEPVGDTWLYEACNDALEAAVANATELNEPPPGAPTPAQRLAPAQGEGQS
jgi:hypothetical protein